MALSVEPFHWYDPAPCLSRHSSVRPRHWSAPLALCAKLSYKDASGTGRLQYTPVKLPYYHVHLYTSVMMHQSFGELVKGDFTFSKPKKKADKRAALGGAGKEACATYKTDSRKVLFELRQLDPKPGDKLLHKLTMNAEQAIELRRTMTSLMEVLRRSWRQGGEDDDVRVRAQGLFHASLLLRQFC